MISTATMTAFCLSGIRDRLWGGILNKARRGELKLHLPVGLVYDPEGKVVLDPNTGVAEAIHNLFETFRHRRSANRTLRWLRANDILLPSRPIHDHGQLRWNDARYTMVLNILRNPRYAGCYAFGKVGRTTYADGRVVRKKRKQEDWTVCIPDFHEGFISWKEYQRNQRQLEENRLSYPKSGQRQSPPRNGSALLQSRAFCGQCGGRMTTKYISANPKFKRGKEMHYMCMVGKLAKARKCCQRMRGEAIDAAVSSFVVKAVNQHSIDLAIAFQERVKADFAKADRQRALLIDDLRHRADQAERRYLNIDNSRRMVADRLEELWNNALLAVEKAEDERERQTRAFEQKLSNENASRIRELAQDFAVAWNAKTTENIDRKRMLGLLVEDAMLTRTGHTVSVQLRMRGGKTVELEPVKLLRPGHGVPKAPAETIAEVIRLAGSQHDKAIADELNRRGFKGARGKPMTSFKVTSLRHYLGIPSYLEHRQHVLREEGWSTAAELSTMSGIEVRAVRERAKRGESVERTGFRIGKRPHYMYRLVKAEGESPESPFRNQENEKDYGSPG